jgi:hypothetical protein
MEMGAFQILQEHKIGSQLSDLKVSMYYNGKDDFPRLKSQAAETRHLCGALLYALEQTMDAGNAQHKTAKLLLGLARSIEKLLDDNKNEYRLSKGLCR